MMPLPFNYDHAIGLSVVFTGGAPKMLALNFNLGLVTADDPAWERLVNARELFQLPATPGPCGEPVEYIYNVEAPAPREVSPVWAVAPRLFALFTKGNAP